MSFKNRRRFQLLFMFVITVFHGHVNAVEIDIEGKQTKAISVAIVPFAGSQSLPFSIHEIVANDLRMSGKFEPIDSNRFLALPSRQEEVQYRDWLTIGADLLAIGQVSPLNGENFQVTVFLFDVAQRKYIGGYRYNMSSNAVRFS